MVLSASSVSAVLKYKESPYYFFTRQLVFIVISYIVGLFIILRMPIKTYKKLVPFALFGVFSSLAYLLISGDYTNGARSWIDLGFFSLQPSEFAKTVLVLFMAIYYGNMLNMSFLSH